MNTITLLTEDQIRVIVGDVVRSILTTEITPHRTAPDRLSYVTRHQVCQLLHITLPTLHSWMKQGKLKAYHIGGRTLFKESEIMASVQPVNYSIK